VTAADQVASVVIARSGQNLSSMKVQKLLYYVQAWHLAITDAPAFDEKIKAWAQGPVVPQVWHARKDPATRRPTAQDVEEIELDDVTSDLIDLVLAMYGSMSGDELSALTHAEEPWRAARGEIAEGAHSSNAVDWGDMARFYRAHRVLGGRTAVDLAAGGIHVRNLGSADPIDVDALLADLGDEFDEIDDSPWGSANLQPVENGSGFEGIRTNSGPVFLDA